MICSKIKMFLILIVVLISACTRIVYVPYGQAVQLRETIKDAKIWVETKPGDKIPGKMDLLEGWWVTSYEEEESEKK